MDSMVGKAWDMFSSRAYVHQYTKHGLTEDEFLDGFATLEQVIANYKHLWSLNVFPHISISVPLLDQPMKCIFWLQFQSYGIIISNFI